MNRSFLRWFYLAVQFVMLAVSIPKVAMLFHAYDLQPLGPLIGDIDLRSWLVGIAIDMTATFTTWAAMHRFEETRKRLSLLAPAFIIIVCTGLSVIANYEDAATLAPKQYAGVSLFAQSALFINPILISAPPVLVFLLILLVPSVLAQPRIKTAEEVLAETAQQEAQIEADARLREAKARANARVRGAQIGGLADNFSVVAQRTGLTKTAQPDEEAPRTSEPSAPRTVELLDSTTDPSESAILATPSGRVSRAMWNSMPLKERVMKSGLITIQEIAEVLGVSATRARELSKEVRTANDEQRAVPGRTGVPYQALIDALFDRRTNDSFAQAQKLEKALGLRRRSRQLQAISEETMPMEAVVVRES